MKKDRSIIVPCPCCDQDIVVDLNTGELWAGDQVFIPEPVRPVSDSRSGITVQHATPEFHEYRDSTHFKAQPVVQPIAHPVVKQTEDEPVVLEPPNPELVNRTNLAIYKDLQNRRLIP